jgi:hypothetical protein
VVSSMCKLTPLVSGLTAQLSSSGFKVSFMVLLWLHELCLICAMRIGVKKIPFSFLIYNVHRTRYPQLPKAMYESIMRIVHV